MWLRHGDELKVARGESKFIIRHSSFIIKLKPPLRRHAPGHNVLRKTQNDTEKGLHVGIMLSL